MIATIVASAEDGVVVSALQSGLRGPAVVYVHGVGSTAEVWRPQIKPLQFSYRNLAINLRGAGAGMQDPAPEKISRPGYVRDVLGVMDAIGIPKAHFVGCSLGGVVGFELWGTAPQRVASFTFVGSFAVYPDGQRYADEVKEAVRQAGSMEAFATARVARLGLSKEREKAAIEEMAAKSVPSYIAATQATWTADYRAMLPTISVPTLVVVGERDTVAPPAMSREIAEGIPGARMEVLAGAGHVANADAPEAFNELLREFLG